MWASFRVKVDFPAPASPIRRRTLRSESFKNTLTSLSNSKVPHRQIDICIEARHNLWRVFQIRGFLAAGFGGFRPLAPRVPAFLKRFDAVGSSFGRVQVFSELPRGEQ